MSVAATLHANNIVTCTSKDCTCRYAVVRMRALEELSGIGASIVMHPGGTHLVNYGRREDAQDACCWCDGVVPDYHLVPDGVVYCRIGCVAIGLNYDVSKLFDELSSDRGIHLDYIRFPFFFVGF